MHAIVKPLPAGPLRTSPLAASVGESLAGVANSIAWAFAMRRECDRWARSGRRLDGDAIRRISERLSN